MINKKAIFCIPVKNESKNITNLFLILLNLTKLFKDYYIYCKKFLKKIA
jgi:uncharacterized protein (UPF0262 family)